MPSPRIDNLNSYTNLIINGNFDVWQRTDGASINFTTTRLYNADRWSHERSSGYSGNSTAARSTDVPTLAQSGFQSSYSLLATNGTGLASTGSADYHVPFMYRMEGQDYQAIHGQACRIQFWIKSSVAGTYSLALRNRDSNRSYVTTFTINSANTWEKETIDLTMDTAAGWSFANDIGLVVTVAAAVGSSYSTSNLNAWQSGNYLGATSQTNWAGTTGATMQIAQFMLVKGSFASSTSLTFQRAGKTIADELMLCYRYCYVPVNSGVVGDGSWLCALQGLTATSAVGVIHMPAPMRTKPNISVSSVSHFELINGLGATGPSAIYMSPSGASSTNATITVDTAASFYTINNFHHLRYADGTFGNLTLSAEL